MRAAACAGFAALLALAACHGHPAPTAPVDQVLEQAAHAGREALSFGHPDQAVTQYKHAFSLALARDDASAVGDCGYDLAVAQLAAGDAAAALETGRRTRDALRARGAAGFADLDLVQAAALHHLGRDGPADALAARAQAIATDAATVIQASRLRGLIAEAHGDQAGLVAALDALGMPKHPSSDWRIAHEELTARLALLRGDTAAAASHTQAAASIQRAGLHYRGMASSLALAALAMRRGGDARASADLYLQAGESAAARGDVAAAAPWLEDAAAPGGDLATTQAALRTLSTISPPRHSGQN